ncbi:MAG: tellurite resistance/C4-dicarboxylate transporter family protein [Actinobacteria bacterium]|nr:tellurite resistance/C4-dicarboxylate transporter family protein [Actinomycetota bacterium]
MATGIISIGCYLMGPRPLAYVLFALNAVAYLVIWGITALRVRRYPRRVLEDLTSHQRGFGFLTAVAATGVLGAETIVIAHEFELAVVLLAIASVLWLALIYTVFTALTIKHDKPSLAQGISGTWLLAVVATQAIAVLTALLAAHWGQPLRLHANFVALSMWLFGGMLYIWIISLIFYRYTFFRFEPDDLAPPYWINMGAMAISVLAGSLLVENSGISDAPFLHSLRPFLEGFTVFYWATGTWWIPIIAILAVWRYGYKRLPFEYDPLYWGAVFPLGMYAVATYRMAEALSLEFLEPLPQVFLGLALAAWAATFVGLLRRLRRL